MTYTPSPPPEPAIEEEPIEPPKESPPILVSLWQMRQSNIRERRGKTLIEASGLKFPIISVLTTWGLPRNLGELGPISTAWGVGEEEYVTRSRIEERQIARGKAGPKDIHAIL